MKIFKTLVFKNQKTIDAIGKYVRIVYKDIGGSSIPQLMTKETTMRKIQELYPEINFNGVKLVIVKLSEIKT